MSDRGQSQADRRASEATVEAARREMMDTVSQLADAEAIVARIQANPAVSERLTRLARLVNERALAGNFNCVC